MHCFNKTFNSRKSQTTNQKYRNLVGSDQQMQRLEETELRKADRTVGVNNILSMQNSMNLSETFIRIIVKLRMKNRTSLNLGKIVSISIIHHIPDS